MNKCRTDLMIAAQNGNKEKIENILTHSLSEPCAFDPYGWTALMWAARNGHDSCLQLLLPVSDAWAKDNNQKTALMWAAKMGNDACVQLLLAGSDVFAEDKWGRIASSLAKRQEHHEVKNFIDAYVTSLTKRTSLQWSTSIDPVKQHPPRALRI